MAYNGWTNFETWAVALWNYETWAVARWIDNEEEKQDYALAEAAEAERAAASAAENHKLGPRTEEQYARAVLAVRLRDWVHRENPLEGQAGLYADIIGCPYCARERIDWNKLAGHYLATRREIEDHAD